MNWVGWLDWLALGIGCLTMLIYEVRFRRLPQKAPARFSRPVHATIRARWARSLMQRSGQEILAVQTLRNSVMSATIIGSTAAIALMGTISVTSPGIDLHQTSAMELESLLNLKPRGVLVALMILVLFATFVLSVMAVRFFNHTGYIISMPSNGQRDERLIAAAQFYLVQAGNYYSMSMRSFLWIAPLAAGLVFPLLLPFAALALVWVLVWFDRARLNLSDLPDDTNSGPPAPT